MSTFMSRVAIVVLAVLASALSARAADKVEAPVWKHGVELLSRKAGEERFTKATRRYGIEVYLDENNGNTVYICETGKLSIVPGKEP
jgi:hypothetical protein